ncbi:FadR family transcriptional regulator [Microvirga sp. BT688]|uniref:FadR/GntR family transcriptional regulator n=1 Tax=Microvirga sp. TaxID=1873136 RepID=UPI001689AB89|nr:GntR family transcriptional regulator [Microvirga sp.]MBD2746740.1 FadR family transcriptional regulator [Microvirga sp.]
MPNQPLDLQLSLLRGESPCPINLSRLGRPGSMRMKTQTKAAISDRLAVRLLMLIASRRLPSGSRLPPERHIAEALSVSRGRVRAALDRLKTEGYLESVQGSGTRVADSNSTQSLEHLTAAHMANLRDLEEICVELDRWALTRAVLQGTREQIEKVIALLTSVPCPARLPDREVELRLAIADASGSETFRLLIGHLVRGLEGYFWRDAPGGYTASARRQLRAASSRLARALQARDLPAVETIMAARAALLRERSGCTASRHAPVDLETDLLNDLLVSHPDHLRNRLAREIAAMMARQRLKPGERIMSERQLADVFGVSRMTVREALAQLKEQGFVSRHARSGTHAEEAVDASEALSLQELSRQSYRNFSDLCSLRHFLETWSATRAAVTASEEDLADMRRILSEMRRPIAAARRKIDLDLQLHLTITRASGSAVNLYITEVLRDAISAYFDFTLTELFVDPGSNELLLSQHEDIVRAILARDPEGARGAMTRHLEMFRNRFEQACGPAAPWDSALH